MTAAGGTVVAGTVPVDPLTCIRKDGTRYERSVELELEIAGALERPLQDLIGETGASPRSSGCLLYFVRRFRPNRRTPFYDRLLMLVFERADRIVRNNLHGIAEEQHDEIRLAVRDRIMDLLLTGSEKLDSFEAIFNRAVKFLTIGYRRKANRVAPHVAIESLADAEDGRAGAEVLDAIVYKRIAQAMPAPEASTELKKVMALLTEKERQAVIAVHVMGLKEESDDPDQLTAAKALGISGRMVRYRLKSAEAKARASGELEA